jgi:hypothetical protein
MIAKIAARNTVARLVSDCAMYSGLNMSVAIRQWELDACADYPA